MKFVRTPGIEVAAAAGVALAALLAGAWVPGAAAAGFDVAWTAGAACALLGMLAARRSSVGEQRATWTWFSLAAGSWLLGQLAWDAFAFAGTPPSPNLADAGWWGFALLVVVGLLQAPGRIGGLRVVRYVEALPLVASAVAVICSFMWEPAMRSPLSDAARVSALVYPTLYVSAAVVTLQAMVAGALRRSRGPGVPLVLLGVTAQALAFILWGRELLGADYVVGRTLVDPLWVLGLVAVGTGGAATARATLAPAEPAGEPGERGLLLPALMFALLIAGLLHAQVTDAPMGARFALTAGLTICGATLVARGVLLLARERDARQALARREAELERLTEQLGEETRRDPLTGLRNRRALGEDLVAVEQLTRRRGGSYVVALCDVDHFKAYNDALGHLAGDEALRALAAIIRGELRAGDVAYRYGGEELLIVLQDADLAGGMEVAQRLRSAVAAAAIPHPRGIDGVVTVSIGIAAGDADAGELLARADAALYAAKHAGRNRVMSADGAAPASAAPGRRPEPALPSVRHLHSLLSIARAGRRGDGPLPVLEALAEVIRSELRFATVVANLRDPRGDTVEAVVVLGDREARDALLGTSASWAEWDRMLDPRHERRGAYWLPAGSHEWSEELPQWTPVATPQPQADAWHPEDALLLPLRDSAGAVQAIVAVDEPLDGRRPDDEALEVLMAVADHGAAVLEQIAGEDADQHQLAAVLLLAESLDLRDAGTALHSQTVGELARATAEELGLPADRVERVRVAGVLHDVGKLAIPDAILHKPGKLNDAEWREMRRHPEIGARILAHAGLGDIAGWVQAHHERVDGRGYPLGLSDAAIPLEAKVLAVADAFEAMIADRPYRAGMDPAAALQELRECAGAQFDQAVVDAFLRTRAPAGAPALSR
ncbi:MAG TPA: diguanylate cyclase [Solirubrobacteraceae bacterium]